VSRLAGEGSVVGESSTETVLGSGGGAFLPTGRSFRLRSGDDDLGRKPAAGRRGLVQADVVLDGQGREEKSIHLG
jgi:hypothetical protein